MELVTMIVIIGGSLIASMALLGIVVAVGYVGIVLLGVVCEILDWLSSL